MIAIHHDAGPPGEHNFFDGHQSDARVGVVILVCLAGIALSTSLFAAIGIHLGIGPRLEPVAYLFIAVSAAVFLVPYLLTFVDNEIHAALYMLAFWGLTLTGVYVLFYAFG